MKKCAMCPNRVVSLRFKYCSFACRMAAYRLRHNPAIKQLPRDGKVVCTRCKNRVAKTRVIRVPSYSPTRYARYCPDCYPKVNFRGPRKKERV